MTNYTYWDTLDILGLSESELDDLLVDENFLDPSEPAAIRCRRAFDMQTVEPLRWTIEEATVVFPAYTLELYIGVHLDPALCQPWQRQSQSRYLDMLEAQFAERIRAAKISDPDNWEDAI